jgi:alpha-amylase
MQRRPEAYHCRLREASPNAGGGVASIHDQVRSKEDGLERFLRYDRWARNSFRLLVFPAGKTFNDYEELKLGENPAVAGGAYSVCENGPTSISLECSTPCRDCFAAGTKAYHLHCATRLSCTGGQDRPGFVGMELVLNFLATNEPDRYFEIGSARHPLSWSAAILASGRKLRVVDEWQNVAATIEAPAAQEFWIAPIETVSESEEGFERVYQGSQILAVWPVDLSAGKSWTGDLTLHVESAYPRKPFSQHDSFTTPHFKCDTS